MKVLAVIPARGGSKGLPRKNLRLLAGVPLVVHASRFAQLCREIDRAVVSTEDAEIADVARSAGAEVLCRPEELARDETPIWLVLRDALERVGSDAYDVLVLLDPTSPAREPTDVTRALEVLKTDPHADGVVSVSKPAYSSVWNSVVERDGYLKHVISEGAFYARRQDARQTWVIDGTIYAWRTAFVRHEPKNWFHGNMRALLLPTERAFSIDEEWELVRLDALVRAGVITLASLRDEQ